MGEPTSEPSPAKLKKAFVQDMTRAWNGFRSGHAAETPYAFVLYGLEGGLLPHLYSVVLTEESLTRVAQRYLEKGYHDTLEESRKALRYSVADSPHFASKQETLPTVDALLAPCGQMDETEGYALLAKAALAAFAELDEQGLFGTGKAREGLLLFIRTEDTEKDWTEASAKKLNPPAVFQRFQDETKIEGTFASCGSLARTADGGSFFACITRKDPSAKPGKSSEFMREISGFNRQGPRLTRRWTIPESGKDVACTPDGGMVVALQAERIDKVCHCNLVRLRSEMGAVMKRVDFIGEPSAMALAGDGSRVAVTTHDSKVRVFDGAFQLLHTVEPGSKPKGVVFLRGGALLIATDKGVLRMDTASGSLTEAVAVKASGLSVDDAEELLCVSRWFFVTGVERDPNAFGVKVFRLASKELVGEFMVPGHHCVHGTISPDGKVLAMEAHQIGTMRKFILVFDVATGQEIARRKSPSLYQLSFLPDSQTLAIAFSGHVIGEPIAFWTW